MNAYKDAVDGLGLVFAMCDEATFVPKLVTDRFEKLVGSDAEAISGFFRKRYEAYRNRAAPFADQTDTLKFITQLRVDGVRQSMEFTLTPDNAGGLLIHASDVTENKKLEFLLKSYSSMMEEQQRKLHQMAYTDPLTGVANRRALFEKFVDHYGNAANRRGSVCILDIDHFKHFNDQYGHEFGDHVLKSFSEKVLDVVDEDCFFARVGGEEFCVWSRDRTGTALNELIDRILGTLRAELLMTPKRNTASVSFSAGIAEYARDGKNLDELLNKADKALYYAKATGRSRVISFSTELFEKRDDTLIPRFRLPGRRDSGTSA